MITEQYIDLTSMYHDLVERLAWDGHDVDLAAAPAMHSYDNFLRVKQATFENFDLGQVGMTKSRWARFLRDYIDVPQMKEWLVHAAHVKKPRTAALTTKPVGKHSWGNCLVSIGFRLSGQPTIVAYSRASGLVPTGAIDLACFSVVARHLSRLTEIPQTEIHLTWYVSQLFVSGIYWLPYLASSGREKEFLQSESRLARTTQRCFNRWINQSDNCKHWHRCLKWSKKRKAAHCRRPNFDCKLPLFSPAARAVNRYFRIKQGIMPRCLVKELDFP